MSKKQKKNNKLAWVQLLFIFLITLIWDTMLVIKSSSVVGHLPLLESNVYLKEKMWLQKSLIKVLVFLFQLLADNLPGSQFVQEVLKLLNKRSSDWLALIRN